MKRVGAEDRATGGEDRTEESFLLGGAGDDTVYSAGDGKVHVVDCGAGADTVKKGQSVQLDTFENRERFRR